MNITEPLINRVEKSGLISFDLETYYTQGTRVVFDMKECLFMGLILKEKDFREYIKNHDWLQYQDKLVCIICSADAIVPTWAYMLLSTALRPYAAYIYFGTQQEMDSQLLHEALSKIDLTQFQDQRVVVKGCGDLPIPVSAYVEISRILTPVVKSLMYGEPCSTVPLYKRK
jgi:hypothetical protein